MDDPLSRTIGRINASEAEHISYPICPSPCNHSCRCPFAYTGVDYLKIAEVETVLPSYIGGHFGAIPNIIYLIRSVRDYVFSLRNIHSLFVSASVCLLISVCVSSICQ